MRRSIFAGAIVLGLSALIAAPAHAQRGGGTNEGAKVKVHERDEALVNRVGAAVSKARAWLEKRSGADGRIHDALANGAGHGPYQHGPTALAALALLHGGGSPFDPAVEKAFTYLKEKWDAFVAAGREPGPSGWKTYEVGLCLMAREARARWKPASMRGKTHKTAAAGGMRLRKEDAEWVKQLRDFLVETILERQVNTVDASGNRVNVNRKNSWSYPGGGGGDHSNTQYAILGLKAASRFAMPSRRPDLRAPYEVWKHILEHFLDRQERSGPKVPRVTVDPRALKKGYIVTTNSTITDRARGWAYSAGAPPVATGATPYERPTGSMTTIGIASVVLAWSEIESAAKDPGWPGADRQDARKYTREKAGLVEKSINDGFAWMDKHFAVDKNPEHDSWHYYYLYSLERAGVLADRIMIGKNDWYRAGADLLLAQQGGDGSWTTGSDGHEVATCFAILFLTKATVPVKGQVTGGH